MRFGYPGFERASFILLELLNESVLHLSEEAGVKFVPLGRLQVSLLQHGCLAEDID